MSIRVISCFGRKISKGKRGTHTLVHVQLVSRVAVASSTVVVPGARALVDVATAVEVATLALISAGRSKVMPMERHICWAKPRVTFSPCVSRWDVALGKERGKMATLLIGDAASAGNLRLQGAHECRGAEAVDVHVGAARSGDGGLGDVLLGVGLLIWAGCGGMEENLTAHWGMLESCALMRGRARVANAARVEICILEWYCGCLTQD